MKQAVIRKVRTMNVGCDKVGNLLLMKFSCEGSTKDITVFVPSGVVFGLLQYLAPNQDPNLMAPPPGPAIAEWDWDPRVTPRCLTVNCNDTDLAFRMTMELDRKPDLTVVLDASNLELMRRFFVAYSKDLINLDA